MGLFDWLFGSDDDDNYEPRGCSGGSEILNVNPQGHGVCPYCGNRLSEKGCCSNPDCPPYKTE